MMRWVRNAQIWTMWPAMPCAASMVVEGDKIAYIGSDEGARRWLDGRRCEEMDGEGTAIVPGFNDAHMHFLHTALSASRVDLSGARSVEEMVAMLSAALGDGIEGWLLAEGWNQERFGDRRLPTRDDLNGVSRDVPIFASRVCGHIAVANDKALALAGIHPADGILREDEQDAVYACLPSPTVPMLLARMLAAQKGLYAAGITSIQSDDLGSVPRPLWGAFCKAVAEAGNDGSMSVRYSLQALCPSLKDMRSFFGEGLHKLRGERYRVSCMKLLADGSLGARTAWMRENYRDAEGVCGIAMYTDEGLSALVHEAVTNGMPAAIHVIGDAAMQQALDCIEKDGAALRHALVHAQIADARQIARCGRMGLIIMAQPIFLEADAPIVRARVGDALAETSYRWRSMLGAGAHVAFSTDCPVEPYAPLPNIRYAMNRKGMEAGLPYLKEEGFTMEEALYAYTAAGAYASGEENSKGQLAPGMLADYVMLDRALDAAEPESLLDASVRQTCIGGQVVYTGG